MTLGQARGAILGGCLLVTLLILAEYGAFEIVGYQTFTTEIFTEFSVSFNVNAASALSLVVVLLSVAVLAGDGLARGKARVARTGAGAQRQRRRQRLGRARVPVLLGFGLLTALALGVPVGSSVYWMFEGGAQPFQGVSLVDAAANTAVYSLAAAAVATLMALPVALLVTRHPSWFGTAARAEHLIVMAVPGVVIGFAVSYFIERYPQQRPVSDTAGRSSAPTPVCSSPWPSSVSRASVAYAPVSLGGGGTVARPAPLRRPLAASRCRSSARVDGSRLPRVSCDGDRADRNLDPPPDRRTDAGLSVLGLPAEPLLRTGGAVRARHIAVAAVPSYVLGTVLRPAPPPGRR